LPRSEDESASRARHALVAAALIVVLGFVCVALVASRIVQRGEVEQANLARRLPSAAEHDAGGAPAEVVEDRAPTVTSSVTASEPPPSPPASRRPARKTNACIPPYSVDAQGMRHFKPECL
jgi:serine/threonine-protein kinase